MSFTPEQEAAYSLGYGVSRADLKPEVQAEYDRLLAERRATPAAPANSPEPSSRLTYRNATTSVILGPFCLFATAIFVGQAFNPGKGGLGLIVFAGASAAATAAVTARCLVAPAITAAHNGVRIRTLLRTRTYAWAEIDRFDVVGRVVGGYYRKVLTMTLKSGKTRAFTQFNGSPRRHGWVDDCATMLSQHLAAKRSAGAALPP